MAATTRRRSFGRQKKGEDMSTAKQEPTVNPMAVASKQLVRSTRDWATALRDITYLPAQQLLAHNRVSEPVLQPWLEMTRSSQDWFLASWEEATNQMIDQGSAFLDRSR